MQEREKEREREPDRDRRRGREDGRDEVEENSAKGLLPDLYSSFIIEAVQRQSRASACVRRNTHRGNHVHSCTRSTVRVCSQPTAFKI